MQCPRCGEFEITFTEDDENGYHRFNFLCHYCGLTYETPEGEETIESAYNKFIEDYWNATQEEYDSASASGGGVGHGGVGHGGVEHGEAEKESNDYECTVFCSFHGNIITPLKDYSDSFNPEFWSGVELMQSVQLGCLSYTETEELLTGLFSDEIGNKKTQYQQFVKPFRQKKLVTLETVNAEINDFLNLINPNPIPTSEPKSDYYQPILIFVNDLLLEKPKKTCRQIIKKTLDHIDSLNKLQPHKYWGYKWFVTHREPERKGEKYKTLEYLKMNLKKITKCNGLIENLTMWLSEISASLEEYHYIYYVRPIETGSIFKIYQHPETQPRQSYSGKKSATDLFNRGVSLILYPNTKLFAAFEQFCVEATDFFIENGITKEDLYAEFKTKEGSLISSPNMKLFCYWLMETFIKDEKKEEMREIMEKVTHDFNLIDQYSITSVDVFKFVEIIDTCLKIGWGETKKIKVIISACRVADERMNLEINPQTTATEDTQPDWGGGKRRKTRRKRLKSRRRRSRKHK